MVDDASASRDVAKIAPPRLPYHPLLKERFGIEPAGWRALTDAIFPSANSTDAIVLALSYCQHRKLDVFKKPVQIVPMWDAKRKTMVDTVWPGIGELRTTAFRTGQYAGCDETLWGPTVEHDLDGVKVSAPEWGSMTVYRLIGGHRVAFHGPRVNWLETYATKARDTRAPNAMWAKRPIGQLEKCVEAAALRKAFPEEIGNEYAAEEMEGRVIDHEALGGGAPETIGVPRQLNSSQAKKANLWPEFEAEIRGFDDLNALEEWWASGATQTRINQLAPKWQDCATEEYERRQEALTEKLEAEVSAERAAHNEGAADA